MLTALSCARWLRDHNQFRALMPMSRQPIRNLLLWCCLWTVVSVIRPSDYWVWAFEIGVGLIGVAILALTYRRFPFSNLVYVLVAIHFVILAIAAKYSYSNMPLFNWLRDELGLARNHFDRVGHFFQGFVPVIIAREILLRKTPLQRGKMVAFLAVAVCLALSAFWELLEWWVVVLFYPESGPEWLGTQGDPWDAQSDMLMCLLGASLALLLLSRLHDRSMAALAGRTGASTSSAPESPAGPAGR